MAEFKYFRVVIPDAIDSATPATAEGYIDDKDAEEFSTLPTTIANSTLKEQANIRWEEILKMLQETGALDVQSIAITTLDRDDGDVEPTQVAFSVKYGADQIVWMHDLVTDATGLTVYGPALLAIANQPDHTYTTATEAAVIERAIATALARGATEITVTFDAGVGGVTVGTEIIQTDAAHGFVTGDGVLYDIDGGTVVTGLTDNVVYFVEVLSADTLHLHLTRAAALALATPIDLTVVGVGTQNLITRPTLTKEREVFDPTERLIAPAVTSTAFPNRWVDVVITGLGTGTTTATRMADIESEGTFTVTALAI